VQTYFTAEKVYAGRRAELEADRQQARTPSFSREVHRTRIRSSNYQFWM